MEKKKVRNSSIELFKIIGIFLIVISHVVQTLGNMDFYSVNTATTSISNIVLILLRHSGVLGNTIFFVCSSWFLLDSKKSNKQKLFQMIFDVWLISVGILIPIYLFRDNNLSIVNIIKQFIPITVANNWYVTCYVLFYLIYPFINRMIDNSSQRELLRITAVSSGIYLVLNFVGKLLPFFGTGFFFTSNLMIWITIYFGIAYMKKYLPDFQKSKAKNLILFILGTIGMYGSILILNYLGLRYQYFQNRVIDFNANSNIFAILMVVALLNLFLSINFKSKIINHISKVSLLIYVIHENVLLREYCRADMWRYIYENYGLTNIILKTLAMTATIFIFSLVVALIYEQTFQRLTTLISKKLYPCITGKVRKLEDKIMSVK